jgi:hypothetical protein
MNIGIRPPRGPGFVVLPAEMIANLVLRDRPQPTAKGVARAIAAKIMNVHRDGAKGLLKDIRRIFGPQLGPPAPVVNERRIQIDKPRPSDSVVLLHAQKQAR